MKHLFLRELRRLAPYGAGGPALGLALLLYQVFASAPYLPHRSLPVQVALGVSALLGVALVAPDTSSGATAFLARQPLAPSRLLGLRLLAASCWLAAGTLAIAATWWLLGVPPADPDFMAYVPLGFGLGALASSVVHRTLPALLLTPALLVAAVIVAAVLPVVGLAIFPAGPKTVHVFERILGGVGLAALGASFVALAWGDRHRASARPALLGLGTFAAALALSVTLTVGAHARSVEAVIPSLEVQPYAEVGERWVVVPLVGDAWTGRERRMCAVPARGGEPWVLPMRDADAAALEPGGDRLLVWSSGVDGWLVDLAERRVTSLPGRGVWGAQGTAWHVTWRSAGPLIVARGAREGDLQMCDPVSGEVWGATLPARAALVGVDRAGRVIVAGEPGLGALPPLADWEAAGRQPKGPRLEAELLAPWPSGERDHRLFALSPSGRWVLARSNAGLTAFDLRDGRRITLPARSEAAPAEGAWRLPQGAVVRQALLGPFVWGFDPSERWLVVERSGRDLLVVDLAAGSWRELVVSRPSSFVPPGWGPGGAWATLPSGLRIDPASGRVGDEPDARAMGDGWLVAWLEDGRALRRGANGRLEVGRGAAWRPLLGEGGAR